MATVAVSIPDEAVAATRVALAHIVARELDSLANKYWPDSDVADYDQSEEDEREGVRSMCGVLRARAAALRSTIREVSHG